MSLVLYQEGATKAQEDEAHWILDALSVAYPGYPWAVRVYDGGFFIRMLDFPANWGMNCKHANKIHSASELKRQVILKAGEFLERANLVRGRATDEPIKRLEGVPDKWQPAEYREQKNLEAVTIALQKEERTTQRPHGLAEENPRSV